MAIIHNYSDKQGRKFIFTILIYILIALVLLLLAYTAYNKLPKQAEQTNQNHPKRTICISTNVTQNIADIISNYDTNNYTVQTIHENTSCDISIERNVADSNEYYKVFSKIFVLAKSYDNNLESITTTQLNTILNNQTLTKTAYSTVWDDKTDDYLRTKFTMGVGQITTTTDNIAKTISNSKDHRTLAIVPFEQLKPTYSVVAIDDNSPLNKNFNIIKYPLVDTYWLKTSDKKEREEIIEYLNKQIQFNNYDPTKVTSLILTGSSSIGSGEQAAIYSKNNNDLFIIQPILNTLLNTDMLHINNESTFIKNCSQTKLSNFLCSDPKYSDILTKLNITVVGVNGNHILDYGLDEYSQTLKTYKDKGIKYYGGGNNSTQASTPLIIEKNGNKIAFLGYNFLYPFSYYATKDKPGSANIDETILKRDIQNAKKLADIIIIDMGWGYPDKSTLVQYQRDFANTAIQAGADIIVGTHSFIPQKLEITNENIIAYNLGSFLPSNFDLLRRNGSMLLKLHLYNGKIIASNIIPLELNSKNQLQLAGAKLNDRIIGSVR